ncbi:MAG: glycosyl transferase family 2 [Chloroflexi bacterium]|nr:glycosyl transferase family 2 [Chloroflexota bacterium]
MATAVLDLDLARLPLEITELKGYDRALILIRFHGRPVGQALLPVNRGRITSAQLRQGLINAAGFPLWEQWLHEYLGWEEARLPDRSPERASVAVCTRDRPADLQRCLDALIRMPDDGQELIVVDNCPSTDATRRLVESYAQVRYVREDEPGLDAARNRALREARYPFVAFTDDDATPDAGWLRALLRNFTDPQVLCVTGLTMPAELETDAQEWFELYNSFARGFKRTVFNGTKSNPFAAGNIGAGVNMALRRSTLENLGPFDEALDAGTPTHSGGDHEMFSRILAAGYTIVYEPAALNWHRHRRSQEELRRTVYGYGVGVYAAWTRSLLVEREFGVAKSAVNWLRYDQMPKLARSLRRSEGTRLDLVLAEMLGCARGPSAYLASRRRARSRAKP